MTLQTSLGRLAKAVSAAVHSFADGEGWSRDDYTMIATFDPDHERIYLVVGSARLVDRPRWHLGIMNNLADEFESRSSAFVHVNLVIRNVEQLIRSITT